MIDTKQIAMDWRYESVLATRPKIEDACNTIASLCAEVTKLRDEAIKLSAEVDRQKMAMQNFVNEVTHLAHKHRW